MLELFSIAGRIKLEGADEAEKSLDKIDKKGGGLGSKLGKVAGTVGKAGALIGGAIVGAGTAAFAATNKITQGFDDISKGAQRLGVSTDAYQELDFWASQNGLSHERMEKAVGRFNQRLGQATDGNEKYGAALERMGVNLDDVRDGTLSTEDAFAQSIQSLSEMESSQEQVAVATEMFGTRMARDLLPALQDGALSMEDAKAKAEELGIVIGEDALESGVKFQDTWDQLKRSMGAVGQQIGAQVIPIFQQLMDWILEYMPQIQEIFGTVFGFVSSVVGTFIGWIKTAISTVQEWFTSNQENLMSIWETYQEYLTLVWELVGTIFNSIKDIIMQVIGYIVPWIQNKLAQLQAFWEQNGEQIMRAVSNAFSFIQGVIEFIMPIIQAIIKGAWDIIQSIFDTAIGIIMGLVEVFSGLLTGDFELIKEGLTTIWESLWEGIKGIVEGAWNLLSGAFGTLWSEVEGWFGDLADDALQWGKNMIGGFVDGIKDMAGEVGKAARNVVGEAADFIKFWSPAKKGEGRYITHWGRNMVDGFLDGVKDESDSVGSTMNNVVSKMNPTNPQNQIGNPITQNSQQQITNNLSMGNVEGLLIELIQAVKQNKDIYLDGNKVTGFVNENNAIADVGRYF